MAETLLSVGLDVGTTSTQMVVSSLTVENTASSFAVPAMVISGRKVLYKSAVHFTPLLDESHIDGNALRQLLEEEYRKAGITPEQVDTGAIIITGETSRKENARTVLESLSHLAGDFVVATAGPDLESRLAARGAGADIYAEQTGETVLHMDIGGGTSNLALILDGKIIKTGCLNVGGRLIKMDGSGRISYVSPVLDGIFHRKVGEIPDKQELEALVQLLVSALETAAGLRPEDHIYKQLLTREASAWQIPGEPVTVSFSGGVADCIASDLPAPVFGDLGPILGRAIRESALCRGKYRLEKEAIRATVIGAGSYSTQLSGSTVFCQNKTLPVKNIPVLKITAPERDSGFTSILENRLADFEQPPVVALPEMRLAGYRGILALADQLAAAAKDGITLCLEQDLAKALGQALAVRLPEGAPILCLDGIALNEGSYLDVGKPVGPALPVVVKTLIMER